MKKTLFIIALLLTTSPAAAESETSQKLSPPRVLDSFSQYAIGKFPSNFRTYPFQRDKAMQVYSVQEENGNRFLHASDDKDISVQVFKNFVWKTKQSPHFSWKWRAITLPKGGAENKGATNDSACGIYVVFGGYNGKVLKYIWSSTLPVGTIHEKKPGKFYFIVLESGSQSLGTWKTTAVNVVEDYKKVFGSGPDKDPSGFGVLTDGNATHTPAACDYDDFKISGTPF